MSSDRIQILTRRIAQLEAELRAVQQQAKAQRQRLADKYGNEFRSSRFFAESPNL